MSSIEKTLFHTTKPLAWHVFDFAVLGISSLALEYLVVTPYFFYHLVKSYYLAQGLAQALLIITTVVLLIFQVIVPMFQKNKQTSQFKDTYFYSILTFLSLPITAIVFWLTWKNRYQELKDFIYEQVRT